MDPISAVAAISSFISVASALQKLLKKLGKYMKTLVHAVSEIATIADQVSGFSLQLIVLQETLEGLPESLQQSVSKRNIDQYHLDGAWKLVENFKELLLALRPLRGSENANIVQKFYARFKWLQTKTKADLFRASLNSSTCSLNLFVSTVILMGKSYESAQAQRPIERPLEGVPGEPPGTPPKGPSGRLSHIPPGNQRDPSLARRIKEITKLQSRLETLKRQVKHEQYKTELGFDACQQLYEKQAAKAIEIRTMERSIKATLIMADEVHASASAMAEEGEIGEEGEMGEVGEMHGEVEEGEMGEMGEMYEEVEVGEG